MGKKMYKIIIDGTQRDEMENKEMNKDEQTESRYGLLKKIFNEIEISKLEKNYKKCIALYLKAANIYQELGEVNKLLECGKSAKEYRIKLEHNGSA